MATDCLPGEALNSARTQGTFENIIIKTLRPERTSTLYYILYWDMYVICECVAQLPGGVHDLQQQQRPQHAALPQEGRLQVQQGGSCFVVTCVVFDRIVGSVINPYCAVEYINFTTPPNNLLSTTTATWSGTTT